MPRVCTSIESSAGATASPAPRHGDLRCKHCGAVLTGEGDDHGGFCSAGCASVYALVQDAGLGAYYQIRDRVIAPADAALLPARDLAWLETAQHDAEAAAAGGGGSPALVLSVQGISCAGCVWLIERLFQRLPGAVCIELNVQLGRARVRWRAGEWSAVRFAETLQKFNYLVGPADASVDEAREDGESRRLGRKIGLCAAFAMNVMLFTLPAYFGMADTFEYAGLFRVFSAVIATASFVVGGSYFIMSAVRALRVGAVHIDLPIALGIVGSFVGSFYGWIAGQRDMLYFDFVSTFILLMLIGRWAQVTAVERNRRRLLARQADVPRVVRDGREVNPDRLRLGDAFEVKPAGLVPVSATLVGEAAEFSLASINGEPEPRRFSAGQRVPAGAIFLGRTRVELCAVETWAESLLARLLEAAERSEARHPVIERVVRGYIVGIIGLALAGGVAWARADGLSRALEVVVAVLVVSCPCALGLALPLADEWAVVALRRRGVFVRVGDLWQRLVRLRRVVFDKTGTLTLEAPVLSDAASLDRLGAEARRILLTLVRDNPHPVSVSLHEALLQRDPTDAVRPSLEGAVREVVGQGVEWTSPAGNVWRLGRPEWSANGSRATGLDDGAQSVLTCDGRPVGSFSFHEHVRSDAAAEIGALRRRGLGVEVLSGDRREKVAALASALGIDATAALGELTPQEKASRVAEVAGSAGPALILGDGANDSLAFDAALCRGTPVIHRGALAQKADFYYLGRGIAGVRALLEVDDDRRRTHRSLLGFMILYNLVTVGVALYGHMNPLLAAVLMPSGSLFTLALVAWGMRRWTRDAFASTL